MTGASIPAEPWAGEAATPPPGSAPTTGDAEGSGPSTTPVDDPEFRIDQAVRLRHGVPFLRSAEPMPMLRPPDLVDRQEVGKVQELRGSGRVAVRFRRGSFLLDAADLIGVSDG
ncbi:MAG: NAD(P)H dehydrogenase assembly family protein [Synechococcaceae cyanobacterium]|nr:NAD(P)H dehydrogenase assembly family protein [Synechococcaceae cyanobacterium]